MCSLEVNVALYNTSYFLEVKFMTRWTKASEEVVSHYHSVTDTYKGCDSTALPGEL